MDTAPTSSGAPDAQWRIRVEGYHWSDLLDAEGTGDDGFTTRALGIIGVSLLLGLLGDWLLVGRAALGAAVFVLGFAVALFALSRAAWVCWSGQSVALTAAGVLFGTCLAWRDSETIRGLNVLVSLFFFSLAAFVGCRGHDRLRSVGAVLFGLLVGGYNAVIGAIPLALRETRWAQFVGPARRPQIVAVLRGLVIATPLLAVFGALFVAADETFSRAVRRLFDWDIAAAVRHSATIVVVAWLFAGYFRRILHGAACAPPAATCPTPAGAGALEAGVVLGSLNLLFAAFVATQIPYLFGGMDYLSRVAGLTASDYARRGFFELVTVAALLLGVLLVADWLLPRDNTKARRVFVAMGAPLIGLLLVVVGSGLQRMILYAQNFGLTELRLYTTAFMLLVAVLFGWFAATALRGDRPRFVWGSLWIGAAAALLVQSANPDARIAAVNLARVADGKPMDLRYTLGLSADAAPFIRRHMDAVAKLDATAVDSVVTRWRAQGGQPWQSLNLGRWRAKGLADSR